MRLLFALVAAAPGVVALWAYVVYPAVLWLIASTRRKPERTSTVTRGTSMVTPWPHVTVTVPVHNGASSIRATLERLLELDYPPDRLQILVISDASNDGTDEIAQALEEKGVELLRLPERQGKTAAENAALSAAVGEILVNVDSSILVPPGSLKKLVEVFADPTIGVASGRDISMGDVGQQANGAESGYVGYEMWIRDLETKVGSIVGASGCFYASRRSIHAEPLPPGLSWDFAAALNARLQGYRSVSVHDATCVVPRASQIRTELKRKVRTMARGLSTLFYYRALMNPFRYGSFAVMLISHKLLRWIPYLVAPVAYIALGVLALGSDVARLVFGAVSAGIVAGILGIRWGRSRLPKPIALAGFVVAVFSAGFLAWWASLRHTQLATWEPTPRPDVHAAPNQDGLEVQLSV